LKKANGLVQTASLNLGAGLYFNQQEFVHKILQGMENDRDVAFLLITDSSDDRFYGYEDEKHLKLIRFFKKSALAQYFSEDYLLIRQSIFFHDEFQGYLYAGFSLNWIRQQLASHRKNLALIMGILLIFIFLFTHLISQTISRPIKEAVSLIHEFSGDSPTFNFRLPDTGQDEFSQLARAFNQLAESLEINVQELEQSKKYIEALFRLVPIPLLITNPKGEVEVANESACRFFEVTPEQLIGQNIESFFNPQDFSTIINKVAESQNLITGYIATLITANGTKKVVELNLSTLRENEQLLKRYIFAIIDVTEKMQIQREILENQTRLHEMNRELIQKTIELKAAIKKNKSNAQKLADLIEISQEIIRSTSTRDILKCLVEKGKSLIGANECIIFLWDPNKKRLVPIKSEPFEKIEHLTTIKNSSGIVWTTFSENQPFLVSESSLTETDFQELNIQADEKTSIISVPVSEKDYKFGVAVFLQFHSPGFTMEDLHLVTTLIHQAAITLDKLYLLQAIREKAVHLEKALEDLRKSQQQIVQLQKMESLGTLVGGIAHDFNNILGIIMPNVELIMMKAREDEALMKRALIIQEAASRAADLTRQLLMFSKNQDVRLEPISPNQLLTRLAAMFRRTLGKHIEVETQLDVTVPYIKADETRLTQVLINLSVNARDAMPEGGKLILKSSIRPYSPNKARSKPLEKYVCIQVLDTGVGIPTEHLDKIFDPFFTTKSVGKGTGLGLSVVYGIVKSHNGFIEVESQPNVGTTFSIYFKPLKGVPQKPAREKIQVYPVGNENILVVDDEDMIRESLKDILQSLGYNVITANSGKTAVELVKENKNLHLAIVDYAMPKMNGLETIKIIRGLNPNIRLLLSSGYAEREQLLNKDVHIDGFIPKPYHITDLARKIKEVLKKPILSRN